MYADGFNLTVYIIVNNNGGIQHVLELSNFWIGRALLTQILCQKKRVGSNMIKSNIKILSLCLKLFLKT